MLTLLLLAASVAAVPIHNKREFKFEGTTKTVILVAVGIVCFIVAGIVLYQRFIFNITGCGTIGTALKPKAALAAAIHPPHPVPATTASGGSYTVNHHEWQRQEEERQQQYWIQQQEWERQQQQQQHNNW